MRNLTLIIERTFTVPEEVEEKYPTLAETGSDLVDSETLDKLYEFIEETEWCVGVMMDYPNADRLICSYNGKSLLEMRKKLGRRTTKENFYILKSSAFSQGLYNFGEVYGAINPSSE